MKLLICILASLSFVACSGSGGGGSSSPAPVETDKWNAYSVLAQSDLPTCSGDIVGRLYYIESTSSFQVCKSTGWTAINVKGNDGTNGLKISAITNCSKTTGGATFKYHIVTFSTGDKYVQCSIVNALNTYTAGMYYISAQNGATNEGCLITYDVDTATSGFWNFVLTASTRTVTYTDAGSASNGSVVTYSNSTDCTTVTQ